MSVFPDTPVTLLARMAAQVTGQSESGWVRFFELYQPVIRKFVEYTGETRDAEDVSQDVFLKLVEVFRRGSYNSEKGHFRSYLATMIRNEVINHWKKASVRGAGCHVSINNDDAPMEIAVPSETEAVLDAKWRLARREATIAHVLTKTALAQKSKDVYREYVINGRSIGDVAREFDIPENSVSQIKSRIERMISDYGNMYEG